MRRILLVDDEPKILRLVGEMLEEAGYSVERAGDGVAARSALDAGIFDLLITDVRLPDASGVELLRHAREVAAGIQVILITAYGTVAEGVEAMKLGAFDYILKPFEMDALGLLVERALSETALREQIRVLRADDRRRRGERKLIGNGAAMQRVRKLIQAVAATPSTVLLIGESGTGKELVAETIHRQSRAKGQLVRVNCPAIPTELIESELFGHVKGAFTGATETRKGLFELADRGTLFLDEVADLPLEMQVKLLRALEDQRITRVGSGREIGVQVRLIAATNVHIKERVDTGAFRGDLFYRLNVFPIELPLLRARTEDIGALSECLLEEIGVRLGRRPPRIAEQALNLLHSYSWPGNVRELRNLLERATVLAGDEIIDTRHLPDELFESGAKSGQGSFVQRAEAFKAKLVLEALRRCGWVKKDAAASLGLSPRALSHYIRKYDLDRQRSQ